MTWSEKQWGAFCSLLREGWPGEFTPQSANAYRALLDDFEPEQTVAALKVLLRKGQRFRPSPAEIVGELHVDVEKPDWPEALRDLRRAFRVRQDYFASPEGKEAVCVEWLREHSHELVAAFFEVQTYERLSQLPLDDPEWGGAELHRLRGDWDRFTERAEGRIARGLPASPPARKQLGPRKPDFAAALPRPARDNHEQGEDR